MGSAVAGEIITKQIIVDVWSVRTLEKLAKQEKEKLEKDPEYLESVAREKLGIVKKGEIVYKLVPEKEKK